MTNNQLAENSITQLLNSVKLARDNAERDDNRVDHSFYYALAIALEELQERRKAEKDSEPVAWLAIYHGEVYDDAIGITRSVVEAQADRFGWESALTEIIPLYRHAQPAPELTKPIGFINGSREPVLYGEHIGIAIGTHLYTAPQPAPVVPEDVLEALQKVARIRLDMNDFDGDRRGIADCLGDAEEALIEVVNRRAAMLNGGKS